MSERRCEANTCFWGLLVLILVLQIISLWHTQAAHKTTQSHVTEQIAELKSQITALTEALAKHDARLEELCERKEWWEAKE